MPRFNKYIKFMDYGDAVNTLTKETPLSFEDAFYFYEQCCDEGKVNHCKTVQEVCDTCVKIYNKETLTNA